MPTSHFLDISVLSAAFHVRDLAQWVREQRDSQQHHGGGATKGVTVELPLLLARDEHAARFARAAAAALNLSFARVATDEPWPNGYQHGSDDAVPPGYWREFGASGRGAAADLLAFGSPVAFGFDWQHFRSDDALRWVRGRIAFVPSVRAEAARVAQHLFGGEPYLAVQIRRGADRLTGFCYNNDVQLAVKKRALWGWNMSMPMCYPHVEEVSSAILATMARVRLRHVYLATDSPRPELFEAPLRAHGVHFVRYADAAPAAAPAEHLLLVDQLVCAHAAFFLGNAPSTVTSTIVHERDKLGLPRNSTDFFGFGPTERADFDSDEWVPTAAFRG